MPASQVVAPAPSVDVRKHPDSGSDRHLEDRLVGGALMWSQLGRSWRPPWLSDGRTTQLRGTRVMVSGAKVTWFPRRLVVVVGLRRFAKRDVVLKRLGRYISVPSRQQHINVELQ
jgi:hypothetical protein